MLKYNAIESSPREGIKEWMIWIFEQAGKTNRNIEQYQFWQQHNHPAGLSSHGMLKQRLIYQHENPIRFCIVQGPQYYSYRSASEHYTTIKDKKECSFCKASTIRRLDAIKRRKCPWEHMHQWHTINLSDLSYI